MGYDELLSVVMEVFFVICSINVYVLGGARPLLILCTALESVVFNLLSRPHLQCPPKTVQFKSLQNVPRCPHTGFPEAREA